MQVLDAACQIPLILNSAQRVLGMYRDSAELQQASKELYGSILICLGHMLRFLRRKSRWKVLEAGFKQQAFEAELLDKIKNVENSRDAFNEQAEICHKLSLQDLRQKSEADNQDLRGRMQAVLEIQVSATLEEKRTQQIIVELQQYLKESLVNPVEQLMELLTNSPTLLRHAWALRTSSSIPSRLLLRYASDSSEF